VRTRVATQLDEAAALDVVRADGDATGRQPSKATLAALRAVLRSPTALTLVADDDGSVVGLLVAELRGRQLQLSLLCVAPGHRGRGAGGALVRALLERYPDVTAVTEDQGALAVLDRERALQQERAGGGG
jgi:predicted N-acetyltransferase YhbS